MFLNKNKPVAKSHDSTSLGEVAKSHASPGQRLLAYGLMIVAMIIFVGFAWWRSRPPSVSSVAETASEPDVPPKLEVPALPVEAPVAPPPGMAPAAPAPTQTAPATPAPPPVDQAHEQARMQAAADRAAAMQRKLSPGFDNDEAQRLAPATAPAAAPTDNHGGQLAQPGPPAAATGLGAMLVPTSMPSTAAGLILNPHTTMISGTSVTCSLGTAISTEQSGVGFCTLDYPIKSMDGYAVLLERGTRVNYEYARGMNHGAKSIFILYTDAITPEGVFVQLASPGTDPLGRSGLAGEVDNKWMARYSGALMFSLLQDLTAIGSSRGSGNGGNTQINLPNTQGTGTTAAGEILRQNSDVQPSMEVAHGTSVGITIAGNKDFSHVYGFKLKESTQ